MIRVIDPNATTASNGGFHSIKFLVYKMNDCIHVVLMPLWYATMWYIGGFVLKKEEKKLYFIVLAWPHVYVTLSFAHIPIDLLASTTSRNVIKCIKVL